ncbi:MAG: DUF192 domain-containing protein [Halobacteriales archaeon]
MRVVHDGEPIATEVEVADSFLARARGLMFRRPLPADGALVFPFEAAASRSVHMAFVTFPIDAVWVLGGTVEHVKRLAPWVGLGRARADTLIELPAGTAAAAGVAPGDPIGVEGEREI